MNYNRERGQLKRLLGDFYDTLSDYECILAGGAITSLFTRGEINDFDIYFRSKERLADFLYQEMDHNWIVAHTDKSILFRSNGCDIQVVAFRYFDDPADVFESFDFTVCMGAYDFKTEEFVFHEDFFKHNSQRILVFNEKTAFPIISGLRVAKYKGKGYDISKTEFVRVMLTIQSLEITDYDTLVSQIGGMYGERYDNWITKRDEFDMSAVISDLKAVEPGAEQTANYEIDDWDEFVLNITGVRQKAVKHKEATFIIRNGCFDYYHGDETKVDLVDVSDIVKMPLYFYKYVKRSDDGRYYSHYDPNFEYKIGDQVKAISPCGLYCVHKDDLASCSYSNEKDTVPIRLRVDSLDDIIFFRNIFGGTVQVKQAFFEEVLSEPCNSKSRSPFVEQ